MLSFRTFMAAVALSAMLGTPLAAGETLVISDAYARVSTPTARSGAIFMTLTNQTGTADRLIGARSEVAERVELHTHEEDAQGVMRMREVEDGFTIPADGSHALSRGGDHVMLLGLTQSLEHGTRFPLVLVFEQAGEVTVEIPVDLERKPAHGHHGH